MPSTDAATELAKLIVDRRAALHLSQDQLAKLVGVSYGFISHIEKGRRPIGDALAGKLAQALEMDLKTVLRFDTLRLRQRADAVGRNYETLRQQLAEAERREGL